MCTKDVVDSNEEMVRGDEESKNHTREERLTPQEQSLKRSSSPLYKTHVNAVVTA